MLKDIRSLSTCSPPAKLPLVMDPSEKSWYTSRIDLIGIDTSLENQKYISGLDLDVAKYVCVNPYEINPLVKRTDLETPSIIIDIPVQGESSAIQENVLATSSSGFYGNQRKIKLEMEEFGDLSSFLPKPMLINSVDELNTPIFEKDAFDFDISSFQKNGQADFFVKLEYDANYRYKNITPENNTNIFNEPEEVHRNESIPSEIGSNIHLQQSDTAMYSPVSDNGTYIYRTSQSNESPSIVSYDVNDSALSVKSRHSSYPSSPYGVNQFHKGLETPDDSFSSYDSASQKRKLSLDINQPAPMTNIVSTPNIIADVVDLESATFNILDLVEDDIPQISTDDIFGTSTVTLPELPLNIVGYGHHEVEKGKYYQFATRQPQKCMKSEDYDDEDYVPPTKRKILHPKRKIVIAEESSDSESECEVYSKSKSKRRGRPPKRTASISSDHSKDSDTSKYRELRDKNNEASRKSRLKRKTKELEIETEAEELTTKNIKLKAQVEELEKIVKNYKDNIFKIMLNKK